MTWYRLESDRWSCVSNCKRFVWMMAQAEERDGHNPRVIVGGRQVWPAQMRLGVR